LPGDGERLRILAIGTEIAEELVDAGFNGVFTVEAA
jgi:predicted aspartyl protease